MNPILDRVFTGDYSYQRVISSPQLSLQGTACFEHSKANQKIYMEQGSYFLDGKEQTCYQKQFFSVEISRLYIHKSDHSLLHEFSLNDVSDFPFQLTHSHQCGNDAYHLTMTIHSANSFSTTYVVQGPFKDYTIDTVFSRMEAAVESVERIVKLFS
ncbi:DUF6314 family protein [Candidatus Finniella inopinata]|uniref:DUF6314 domain-containing protein n=1 Tax=Candidatus Finniella inopinata TaxID=1696036 RepID=A0A4Q7DL18_9PROT|nr:DUF6314 family protein [Candidatus Finniella inopinata]RZI46844.1 hypothetical protein EQU50_01055 [Candidatus Finniella inopinata]